MKQLIQDIGKEIRRIADMGADIKRIANALQTIAAKPSPSLQPIIDVLQTIADKPLDLEPLVTVIEGCCNKDCNCADYLLDDDGKRMTDDVGNLITN